MNYYKKTNCDHCYYPLHLQDLNRNQWIGNTEEFIFQCSFCGKETIIKSNLFIDNHISENYLNVIRDDPDYFSKDYQDKIYSHLKECLECKDKFEEGFLESIENKIKFSRKSLEHFKKYSQQVLRELNDDEVEYVENNDAVHIKKFYYDKDYVLEEDDEFYRDKKKLKTIEDVEEICYFIKEEQYVIGHVSFLVKNKTIVLDRIWFLSNDIIEKRNKFFKDLEQGKIKIKLNTLEKIYSKLNNV